MEDGRVSNGSEILASSDLSSFKNNISIDVDGNKSKLKWNGGLDALKSLVEEHLKLNGAWSFVSACGGYHLFKSSLISINFYTSTNTLVIQGSKQEELKRLLMSIVTNNASQEGFENSTPESFILSDFDMTPSSRLADSNIEASQEIDLNEHSFVSRHEFDLLKSSLNQFQTKVICLEHSYSSKQADKESELLYKANETIKNLERENMELKSEKESLLVALRLLTQDSLKGLQSFNQTSTSSHNLNLSAAKVNNIHQNIDDELQILDKPPIPRDTPAISDANTDNNGASLRNKSKKKRKKRMSNQPTQPVNNASTTGDNSTKQQQSKPRNIFIVGDSLVKHLKGNLMSKHSTVKVYPFPGSTTMDLKDHVLPLLRRQPDEIIVHVGTNSLQESPSAEACANEIAELASLINSHSTKVAVSSLLPRSDRVELKDMVGEVNRNLESLCKRNNWRFIKHLNIKDDEHLNRGRLHLNRDGNKLFASNLINHIKSK